MSLTITGTKIMIEGKKTKKESMLMMKRRKGEHIRNLYIILQSSFYIRHVLYVHLERFSSD